MKTFPVVPTFLFTAALVFAGLACGSSGSEVQDVTIPIAPIEAGSDLSQIDVCQAIPTEDIEAVMGRTLSAPPESFDYGTPGATGCSYQAAEDADGNAYFAYVVITPVTAYSEQALYEDQPVSGIGAEAYFNNGAAARELWVRVNDNTAFVVAFGDVPNEEGAKALARLLVAAIH